MTDKPIIRTKQTGVDPAARDLQARHAAGTGAWLSDDLAQGLVALAQDTAEALEIAEAAAKNLADTPQGEQLAGIAKNLRRMLRGG